MFNLHPGSISPECWANEPAGHRAQEYHLQRNGHGVIDPEFLHLPQILMHSPESSMHIARAASAGEMRLEDTRPVSHTMTSSPV